MSSTRATFIQAQTHTTAQRNALPDLEPGRLIWNADENTLQIYNGVSWEELRDAGGTIDGGDITGNIDGNQLVNRVDGALLWNYVDAGLLTGDVDASLIADVGNGGISGTLIAAPIDGAKLSGSVDGVDYVANTYPFTSARIWIEENHLLDVCLTQGFDACCKRINGGWNGIDDRRAKYEICRREMV